MLSAFILITGSPFDIFICITHLQSENFLVPVPDISWKVTFLCILKYLDHEEKVMKIN